MVLDLEFTETFEDICDRVLQSFIKHIINSEDNTVTNSLLLDSTYYDFQLCLINNRSPALGSHDKCLLKFFIEQANLNNNLTIRISIDDLTEIFGIERSQIKNHLENLASIMITMNVKNNQGFDAERFYYCFQIVRLKPEDMEHEITVKLSKFMPSGSEKEISQT